jgi:hypothetical protein
MHCLDCTGTGARVAALGVCAPCGAAVRAAHADISGQHLTRIKPVSRPVATEPPVRRLLCGTCAAAHRAHTTCRPETDGMVRTS